MTKPPTAMRARSFCARLLVIIGGTLAGIASAWLLAATAHAEGQRGPIADAPVDQAADAMLPSDGAGPLDKPARAVGHGAQHAGDAAKAVGKRVERPVAGALREHVGHQQDASQQGKQSAVEGVLHDAPTNVVEFGNAAHATDALVVVEHAVLAGDSAFQRVLNDPSKLAPFDVLTGIGGAISEHGGSAGSAAQQTVSGIDAALGAHRQGPQSEHAGRGQAEPGDRQAVSVNDTGLRTDAPAPAPRPAPAPIQLPHGHTGGGQQLDFQFCCLQFSATYPHPAPVAQTWRHAVHGPAVAPARPGNTPD